MDQHLPVRVKAAVALNCLLSQKEAEDLLRPLLPKILEIYIKLMDQIDNEGLVAALEGIVDSYQNEIVPYAYELIVHLVNAFHKYCHKTKNAANKDDDDEDESEAELAAVGCLEAIRRILQAKLPEKRMLHLVLLWFQFLIIVSRKKEAFSLMKYSFIFLFY